jgi:hypothetical protein
MASVGLSPLSSLLHFTNLSGAWRVGGAFFGDCLIEAHQGAAAAVAEEDHSGNARLGACEIDGAFDVERSFLPADLRFIVLETRIEADSHEAARGKFAASDVVQVVRSAVSDHEGHVGCWSAIGFVQRGAQLAQADILRVSLGEAHDGQGQCQRSDFQALVGGIF